MQRRHALDCGINAVTFRDSTAAKDFIGSGFVLRHGSRLFAITVKHVLLVAGHPALRTVDPARVIDQWLLVAPRSDAAPLLLGTPLNANADEPLDLGVMQRDALVFQLTSAGPFKALELASRPPQPGDTITAWGCTYRTIQRCTQLSFPGVYLGEQGAHSLVDLGDVPLTTIGGLSGGPVLDRHGHVVGIVSQVLRDSAGVMRFAPARLDYLREVLGSTGAGSR